MVPADLGQQLLAVKLRIAAGTYREALDLLTEIVVSGPAEEAHKLVLVGLSFEGLNDVARASEAYDRAASLAPGFHTPVLRQAVLHYHRGDVEAARRLLLRYVQLESGNPEAFFYIALCELDPPRRSAWLTKVAVLDGPSGSWSDELLRSVTDGD